jgi:hypothetical protein
MGIVKITPAEVTIFVQKLKLWHRNSAVSIRFGRVSPGILVTPPRRRLRFPRHTTELADGPLTAGEVAQLKLFRGVSHRYATEMQAAHNYGIRKCAADKVCGREGRDDREYPEREWLSDQCGAAVAHCGGNHEGADFRTFDKDGWVRNSRLTAQRVCNLV